MLMLSLMVLTVSLLVLVVSLPTGWVCRWGWTRRQHSRARSLDVRARRSSPGGQINETGWARELRSRPAVTMLMTAQG
jgi:hypothetical protein